MTPRDWVLAAIEDENAELREENRELRKLIAGLIFAVGRNAELVRYAELEIERRFPCEKAA